MLQVVSGKEMQERRGEGLQIIGRRAGEGGGRAAPILQHRLPKPGKPGGGVTVRPGQQPGQGGQRLGPGRPRYTNYCSDPCTDYLNNPMFHSLHSRGRYSNYSSYSSYWPHADKTITLRPANVIKRPRPSCRVL